MALIIFGKIHFLLISENEFLMEENVTELQVCMNSCSDLSQPLTLHRYPKHMIIQIDDSKI